MLLELKYLWVHYGRAEAVKGVSMQIPEGSIVTLIGRQRGRQNDHLKNYLRLEKGHLGRSLV